MFRDSDCIEKYISNELYFILVICKESKENRFSPEKTAERKRQALNYLQKMTEKYQKWI